MKAVVAILCYLALVVVLSVVTPAEGKWIIRKVSSAVPALPTTNLVVNLAADGDVYNTGTTQATDGQAVETWVDAAGTAQNVTASGTDQPTWYSGGGTPYLDFDGNDILHYNSGTPISTRGATVYAVINADDITASVRYLSITDSVGGIHYIQLGHTNTPANGTPFYQQKGATVIATPKASTTLSTGTKYVVHGNSNSAGNDHNVWVGNASNGNATDSTEMSVPNSDQYSVGANSSGDTEANNFDGKIYHILIYDEEHDASERADTIAYLEDKWGL